jgi:hypothetical protein
MGGLVMLLCHAGVPLLLAFVIVLLVQGLRDR